MATPYADLTVRVRTDKKDFDRGIRQVDQDVAKLSRTFRQAQAVIAGVVGSQIVKGFINLSTSAGQLEASMRALGNASGNAAGAITIARTATRGLVSDYDLAVNLTRSLTLGTVQNAEEFGTLAEAALTLGRAMGLDATFALERLNTGLARQSTLLLDDLGITVDVTQANEKFAASLRKNVSELSDQEKRLAFNQEALLQMESAMAKVGGITETTGDAFARMSAELDNLRRNLGESINQSTLFQGIINGMAGGLRAFNDEIAASNLGVSELGLAMIRQFNPQSIDEATEALGRFEALLAELRSNQGLGVEAAAGGMLGTRFVQPEDISQQEAAFLKLIETAKQYIAQQEALAEATEETAEAFTPIVSGLEFSLDTAQRLVDALEAAKEAVAGAEFANALNPSDETRKNLEEARAELERILKAAESIGGLGKLEILLETVPERRPPGRTIPRRVGPGTFATDEELGIDSESFRRQMMRQRSTVPRVTEDVQVSFGDEIERILKKFDIDFGRTLETTLGGLLSGGVSSLVGLGTGLLGQAVSGFVGTFFDDSLERERAEREKAIQSALEENSRAIEQNTKQLLGGVVGTIPGADINRALQNIDQVIASMGAFPVDLGFFDLLEGKELEDAIKFLEEMAEKINYTLILEQNALGAWTDESVASLQGLSKALQATQLSLDTFNGQMDLLQRRAALLDLGPIEQFQQALGVAADFAGEWFPTELGSILGQVSEDFADTIRGLTPENFDEFVNRILALLGSEQGFDQLLDLLGGISVSDFLNWLGFAESALDRLEDSADSAAEALRNVPTGFKYALSVFQASDPVQRSASSTSDLVMGMGATGGGMTVNISVNGAGNPSEVAQAVAKEFRREYERGGYGNQRLAGIGR